MQRYFRVVSGYAGEHILLPEKKIVGNERIFRCSGFFTVIVKTSLKDKTMCAISFQFEV